LKPASRAGQPTSLLRNGVAQSGNFLTTYALSFVAAPIVVAGLGIRAFGIWALTGALAQYGGLIDLGVGRSLSRHVAANHSDRRACGEYLTIGFVTVLLVGVIVVGVAEATAPLLARNLHVSTASMRVVLACSCALLVCAMLTAVVSAYPIGRQRMVTPNIASTGGSVINFVASVGSIAFGARLPGYAIANASAGLITVTLVTAVVLRFEGAIPLSVPGVQRTKDFLRYAVKTQLSWAMELVNYQSDKIVIAFAVGPAAAGSYELANRVAFAARQVGVLPSMTLLPTLTAELSRSGIDHLRRAYHGFTQMIVSVGFPALWLTAALSPLLLAAWLSHVPHDSAAVLLALSIAYLANVSSDVGKVVASAAGDLSVVVRTSVATAIVNLVLTALLAPLFGLWGVLAGTVVALTGGALIQVAVVQKQFALAPRAYITAVLPTLRLCALLAIPLFVVSYSRVIQGRLAAAAAVVILSSLYLAAYMLFAARAGRLPQRIVTRIPALRRFTVAA
jgi:O-antigen/teichoic acid export membrane protein